MGLRSRRQREREEVAQGEHESIIGEEHAWWAERDRLQRVFVVSAENEASGRDDSPLQDFWSPESLFSYDQRPTEAELDLPDDLPDPHGVLELPSTATWHDVTLAHRRLAKRYHPDLMAGAGEGERAAAAEQMRQVNRAYSQLQRQRRAAV